MMKSINLKVEYAFVTLSDMFQLGNCNDIILIGETKIPLTASTIMMVLNLCTAKLKELHKCSMKHCIRCMIDESISNG